MSTGISTAFPPAPPGRGPASNTVSHIWEYRTSSSAVWQTFSSLAGVTANDTGVSFSGLTNATYEGYQFRMRATATQTLQNPPETITTTKTSNIGTVSINTQTINVDNTPRSSILSVTSLGPVVDTLGGGAPGPAFRLRSTNAIGREVTFSTTNNSGQFSSYLVVSPWRHLSQQGKFTITSDDMVFYLVAGQAGGNGMLHGLRRRMPENETLGIYPVGTGWDPYSASTGYVIQNGAIVFNRTITPSQNIDEGQTWTVTITGANGTENTNWQWQTPDFIAGVDVFESSGIFPVNFVGADKSGSTIGSFQVKTLLKPTDFNNKSGLIKVFNSSSILYTNIQVNIRNIDTPAPNITLNNLSRNTSVAWSLNKSYSGALTLNVDGSSIVGSWGTGIPDSSKIRLSNIRHAPGSPYKSIPVSTSLSVTGTTNKTISYSIAPISDTSGDPSIFVMWTMLIDVYYDNLFIGTFTTTINFNVLFLPGGFGGFTFN